MGTSAAILAGGAGRRLGGVRKALIEIDGRRIVERQLDVLCPLVDEVLLVVDAAWSEPVARARRVIDRAPGLGPLGGLATALGESRGDLIVVGSDLPFLDEKLLRLVRDHAPGAPAVVPRVGGRPQPLHARYARAALPFVEARLARGALRLVELLDELAVAWLDEPALRAVDPTLRGLTNVNTPEDLARARRPS